MPLALAASASFLPTAVGRLDVAAVLERRDVLARAGRRGQGDAVEVVDQLGVDVQLLRNTLSRGFCGVPRCLADAVPPPLRPLRACSFCASMAVASVSVSGQ